MTIHSDRATFIGGTDAGRIVKGDWFALWQEKMGLVKPEDLTASFPVQLGIHTERFHIQWLNKFHGFQIGKAETFVSKDHPWLIGHADGWCCIRETFVDTKHSNARANRETMVEWYLPQMAHYCLCSGKDHGWLSFIAGNAAPEFFKITPGKAYLEYLFDLEKAFWWHVEQRVPPDILPTKKIAQLNTEAESVLIDDMRSVDMNGNNNWASLALDYLDFEEPSKKFEQVKKKLKEMVEPDVRHAYGYGIAIKRNKAGSLSFSKE